MRPDGKKSKAQRAYDASRRQEQARQQRLATLDHSERLFLERGYVATTVGSIARAAGVSAATIYKTYGGKAGLVRALCNRALTGDGPVPAETRSDALRASTDARSVIDGWGTLTAEVSPRTSPLLLLLRAAAATDGDAAALYSEFDGTRLLRMAENARYLAEGGHLRAGVTAEEARDVLWLCTSPELYELLVVQRGWSTAGFGTFVSGVIAGALR
ncbi:MAG: helix-turn-helix domain-containing protein [Aquihabitans sp.]